MALPISFSDFLKDPNFAPIHDKLNELKEIEYVENEQAY
jgi:hypothetical protein